MTEHLDSDSRNELVAYRLHRAESTLAEADCLAANGMFSGAMNRLYYACYYAVSSLLIANEIQAVTHAGVRRMFGLKMSVSELMKLGNPLERLDKIVDFEVFRPTLEDALVNKNLPIAL